MPQPLADEVLRQAYQTLMADRTHAADLPDISVETIAALAQGTYQQPDRVLLLDQVLAHPVTARELGFFRRLAASTPAPAVARHLPMRWLALAATVVLAVGALSIWRTLAPDRGEPVRGDGAGFALAEPAPGKAFGRGDRFLWRPATGAQSYRVELVDDEGSVVFAATTVDTVAALPDSARLVPQGRYQVRLVAQLRDGTETTAPVASLIAR